MKRTTFIAAVAIVAVLGMSSTAFAAFGVPFGLGFDFGVFRDKQLALHSQFEYGTGRPLDASSTRQLTQSEAAADPARLVTLANGLSAPSDAQRAGRRGMAQCARESLSARKRAEYSRLDTPDGVRESLSARKRAEYSRLDTPAGSALPSTSLCSSVPPTRRSTGAV